MADDAAPAELSEPATNADALASGQRAADPVRKFKHSLHQ